MVDPVTIGATVSKGIEGVGSVSETIAKSATESLQKSAVVNPGMANNPYFYAEISANKGLGGPMPQGGGMGGAANPGGNENVLWRGAGTPEGKFVGSDRQTPRTSIQKMGDAYNARKAGLNKVRLVVQTERTLNHAGTDLMGQDAKRSNPETNVRTPRWP
ncbi:MAG: hypothetical protein WCE94_08925 [Candidatus Methanoperedens sp.]